MLDYKVNTFLMVAQELNYTKASMKLSITQPAVSKHIQMLEENYGVKLFIIEGKKNSLTKEGLLLQEAFQTLIENEAYLKNKLKDLNSNEHNIRFGITSELSENAISFLHLLHDKKKMQLQINVTSSSSIIHSLQNGDIDFAIIDDDFNKNDVDYQLFASTELVPIVATTSSIPEKLTLKQCLQYPLFLNNKESFIKKLQHFEQLRSIHLNVPLDIADLTTLLYGIQHHDAITFVTKSSLTHLKNHYPIREISISDHHILVDTYVVWLKNHVFQQELINEITLCLSLATKGEI